MHNFHTYDEILFACMFVVLSARELLIARCVRYFCILNYCMCVGCTISSKWQYEEEKKNTYHNNYALYY